MPYKLRSKDSRFVDIKNTDDTTVKHINSNPKIYKSKEFGVVGEFRNLQPLGRIITFRKDSYRIEKSIPEIDNRNCRYQLTLI